MDIKTIIKQAGGAGVVARACTAQGMKLGRYAPHAWIKQGALPQSEWTGKTSYARVICDLARIFGHDIDPLDICPGAAQYMEHPEASS